MLEGGTLNGERIFPAKVVDSIRAGGDKAAFAKAGYKTLEGGSYRSMWWVFHNDHGAYAARGVHGQTIYVDPAAPRSTREAGCNPRSGERRSAGFRSRRMLE